MYKMSCTWTSNPRVKRFTFISSMVALYIVLQINLRFVCENLVSTFKWKLLNCTGKSISLVLPDLQYSPKWNTFCTNLRVLNKLQKFSENTGLWPGSFSTNKIILTLNGHSPTVATTHLEGKNCYMFNM